MKIRNMKQVTERVKGLKGRKLFRRNQIIITTLAVSELCGKTGSGGGKPFIPGRKPGAFRGRPDGGKSGGPVRNSFGHFKSGQ